MEKVRIQLDLAVAEAEALDRLKDRYGLASRKDAVRTALAILEWVQHETAAGRRVMAVGADRLSYLAVPGVTTLASTDREVA